MHALVKGKVVVLTPRELALLHVLMVNASHVLSRSQLMHNAWGDQFFGGPKTVDVCIQRLRNKLNLNSGTSSCIKAVRGFGYTFEKPRALAVADRLGDMDLKLLPRRRVSRTPAVTRL
jgi:DNA-binding response OmpR family regulator